MQWDSSFNRVPWVDYAKGICIVMVVMMHSTLGVEAAAGQSSWMNDLVAFAAPFRMPDFFLIAGLFLMRRIDRDWSDYIDRKVVHFAYFYVLWLIVQFGFKAPIFIAEQGAVGTLDSFVHALVQPFGTLWFIYMLPIFFVVTKLLRTTTPGIVLAVAALLSISNFDTGIDIVDQFAAYFVYFYAGYVLAPMIFRSAERLDTTPGLAMVGLAAWAAINLMAVQSGLADWPLVDLALGFAGAGAVVACSVLLARFDWGAALRYCGEQSIVIYLAFTIPMAVTRTILLKLGVISDLGSVALIVTLAGITGALIMYWIVRRTPLAFLFERPEWAHIRSKGAAIKNTPLENAGSQG